MLILAIESSCDETAAAVVEDGRKVLSSVIASQAKEHSKYGGVVPEIASRMHIEAIVQVVDKALKDVNIKLNNIDAIAVTYAPGLIGALLTGLNFVKGIALATGKPIIPVHHLRAHIAANYLDNTDFKPPFLCLVASGGHSHIVKVIDYTSIKIIGKTRDDAAGEAFDKAARALGLGYPGGVLIDQLAENGLDDFLLLPKPKLSGNSYDFSFSGIKTALINKLCSLNNQEITDHLNDIAASFRKTIVSNLLENFAQVAKDLHYERLALSGGVSSNLLMRKNFKNLATKNHWEIHIPPKELCTDNAAMVGAQGYYEFLDKKLAPLNMNAFAAMSIEHPYFSN